MPASYYPTVMFNNCVPRWQLDSCSVTRPFLFESTASSASRDKKATIQFEHSHMTVCNMQAHCSCQQCLLWAYISHALSSIHGLYGWSCNIGDIISRYSWNLWKLPGHFSYERPDYDEANVGRCAPCMCCSRSKVMAGFHNTEFLVIWR